MTDHSQKAFTATDVRSYYDDLRNASDIASVAGELLEGRITDESRTTMYVDCPRHASQSKRSLQITLHAGLWYCHACTVGGGVIELVEFVLTGVVTKCSQGGSTDTHREARDWLAEKMGLPKLSEAGLSPEKIAEQEKLHIEAEQVFACLTAFAEICHEALLVNLDALSWLKETYGFTDETIAQLRIGLAPGHSSLESLLRAGFTEKTIEAAGLFRFDLQSPAAFFRNRVVFPYWSDGRVVYLIARRTPESEDSQWELPKYKKLPTYDEKKRPKISKAITNSVLYGEDVLRTRPRQVVITEGVTDAIAAMQAGFPTISPATVRISDADFQRITRKLRGVEGVYLVFDNELSNIGAESAIELARKLDRAGIPAEIVTLPLAEKHEKARAEFDALLGDHLGEYKGKTPRERASFVREAFEDHPEDADRAHVLLGEAKSDVNEWFRSGGTSKAFSELLKSAKSHIAAQIDQLDAIVDPGELSRAVVPIVGDIATQNAVAQDNYLQLLKDRTGIGLGALRRMLGEFVQSNRNEERQRSRRKKAGSGSQFRYRATSKGLVLEKPVDGGFVEVPLSNFTATIVAILHVDNGVDSEIELEIEAQLGASKKKVVIPARGLASMTWVMEQLGPKAIIFAGYGTRDHVRTAIQILSPNPEQRLIVAHTGWRNHDRLGMCYVHAGGAIWSGGLDDTVEVRLPPSLAPMVLPKPPEGDELVRAVRASLDLLKLGPPELMFPVFAAIWRAALGSTDFSVHLAGATGVFKTELLALMQAHWGAAFDARHIPGSWSSTGNSLEALAFIAKDALFGNDDFAPTGSSHDVQRYHREADRLLRAVGNRSARGRLRPDGTLRASHPPRALVVSTGEEVPAGQSLRARLLVLMVEKGSIDAEQLTKCQRAAADGLFASAMAGFIRYVASRYEQIWPRLRDRELQLRDHQHAEHQRTSATSAQLQAGLEIFLEFASAVGAIESAETERLRTESSQALQAAVEAQAQNILASEPTALFFALLRSAIAAGSGHIANKDGKCPDHDIAVALGWELRVFGVGDKAREEWVHKGERVGWIDGRNLYLDLPSAFKVAQGQAGATERLTVEMRTLCSRLAEKGYIVRREADRGKNTIRKTLQGARQTVLHVRSAVLLHGAGPSKAFEQESRPLDEKDHCEEGEI